MSERAILPTRRRNTMQAITFGGQEYIVCVGFDEAGAPREVFAAGGRAGSQLQAFIDDACVVLSIALQYGVPPAALIRSLGTLPAWHNGEEGTDHASPLGAICELLTAAGEPALPDRSSEATDA